jgi:WD40 repeat protein
MDIDARFLYSGSLDGTVKQWNIYTGACTRTFTAQNGPVYSGAVFGDVLLMATQFLEAWSISSFMIQNTIPYTSSSELCRDIFVPGMESTCGPGTFGVDGLCIPCPSNAVCPRGSPTPECAAGYSYNSTTKLCDRCPNGFYCQGDWMPAQKCPDNSSSDSGAALATQCWCIGGFYPLNGICTLCLANKVWTFYRFK